jgi:hypothetical protein
VLVVFNVSAKSKTDVSLIDINHLGADKLSQIKNHEKVDWWVEMGDKMLVSFNDSGTAFPVFARIISTQKNVDMSNLAFKSSGHCSGGYPDDKDHTNANIDNFDIHLQLDPYFASGGYSLVSTAGIENKVALMTHEELIPFEKNKVLVYQLENRNIKSAKTVAGLTGLINRVDEDRYMSQIEFLASHDRMTEVGMVAAGEWLEAQFQNLGLTTSRIDPHDRIGFNVLGFKEGSTTPDDWYVVGAHLDSRNQVWNFNLPSPGAEDNASGCSGVLELANVISQFETESSIMFVCFNAEENGLKGSSDLVQVWEESGDLNKVKFMQNMDMIAYRHGTQRAINAGTNVPEYVQFAEILAANGSLYTDINWQINPNACCTDFKSFTAVGIPSISSGIPDAMAYPGYHRIIDLPSNSDKGQGAGVVKANLATLADLAGVKFTPDFSITAAHSGMWYNPEQSGHGVTIEILSGNRILVVWYVFDPFGNQIWLVGAGDYSGNTATVDVIISEQGLFPPDFVAEDVTTTVWGSLQFDFIDCNHVDFSWSPAVGIDYTAGSMQLSQLTGIDGLNCE